MYVCPDEPPLFGDILSGAGVCVEVCQEGSFGDQRTVAEGGLRHCLPACPIGWFAQNDTLRRCVLVCNSTTFGDDITDPSNPICVDAMLCPVNYTGD